VIHKYIFYHQGNQIQTFHFRDQHFELISYKGDKFYSAGSDSFWDWWKKNVSFIDGEDEIDFCFLGDEVEFQPKPLLRTAGKSGWSLKEIEGFISEYIPNSKVKLIQGANEGIVMNLAHRVSPYEFVGETKLFLEIYPDLRLLSTKNDSKEEEIISEEESVLSKYYREKTRRF
jgi:hypothetical protein